MSIIALTTNFRNRIRAIPVACACTAAVLLPVTFARSFAQSKPVFPPDTLAQVGPTVITAQDLIERIEMMPWPGKETPAGRDSAKIRALQSMIAEVLLARDGASAGVASDSSIVRQSSVTERLLVRDALFRRQVRARVSVSEKEIQTGLKRSLTKLRLIAIAARTQKDAQTIASVCARSSRPDSALRDLSPSLVLRRDTASVVFGQLEERFEEAAYVLTTARPSSNPLRTPVGEWVVLYLLDAETSPAAARSDLSQRRKNVEETIRARKEIALARSYAGSVLGPQRGEADPEVFDLCARTILRIFRSNPRRFDTPRGYSLALVADTAASILAADRARTFVQLPDGGMSLGEVLDSWMFISFFFPSLDERDFRLRLNGAVRDVVAAELITREGYRQGLQHSEEVRRDLGLWNRYWTSQVYRSRIVAEVTVSEDDLRQRMIDDAAILARGFEVNIREILSDSLRTALGLLDRLQRGEEMAALARHNTRRSAWAGRDGESGYFAVAAHPELGIPALDAETGKIVGPIALKEGYSIFTLLGKRAPPPGTALPYDSLKSLVRMQLRAARGEQAVNRRLTGLARTEDIRIRYDRLKKIEIMPSNMVTTRTIGFGGSMKAFPPLVPQWEWIEQSDDIKHLLP